MSCAANGDQRGRASIRRRSEAGSREKVVRPANTGSKRVHQHRVLVTHEHPISIRPTRRSRFSASTTSTLEQHGAPNELPADESAVRYARAATTRAVVFAPVPVSYTH